MNKLSSFPHNPARSLKKMEILIELESAVSDNRGLTAQAIREGLAEQGPKDNLFNTIKTQAADHYWQVADVIGYKLLDKIIAFK